MKTIIQHIALQYTNKKQADSFFKKILGLSLIKNFNVSKELAKQIFNIPEEVEVFVYADDKEGYGVSTVFFSYSDGKTSYDDNSSGGWRDSYSNMHFGNLTISVSAMDKKGLISEPVNITVLYYSFGFF